MVGIPQPLVRRSDGNTIESVLASNVDDFVVVIEVETWNE